jgi:hypothetical protein
MGPEKLLLCSNDSTSGPYSKSDEFSEYIRILFLNIYLNIIHLHTTNLSVTIPYFFQRVLLASTISSLLILLP